MGTVMLKPWNDTHDQTRFQILLEVYQLVCRSFGGDYIKEFDLSVQSIDNKICNGSDEFPCAHPDRSMICITAKGSYWCKFVHQISHELCHCITSRANLPQGIRWFDEFLCCFASYFVENMIAQGRCLAGSGIYEDISKTFADYAQGRQQDHIYAIYGNDTQTFFKTNYPLYLNDENLIKNHDVLFRTFFENLKGDYDGLTIIGKIHLIEKSADETVHSLLRKLKTLAKNKEMAVIDIITVLFGLHFEDIEAEVA